MLRKNNRNPLEDDVNTHTADEIAGLTSRAPRAKSTWHSMLATPSLVYK